MVVVYLGIVGGALAFWLWNLALERTTPTRVAVTVAVNPIVASGLGVAVLGEPIAATLVVGLVAVLVGIALTAWPASSSKDQNLCRSSDAITGVLDGHGVAV